MVHIYKTTVLYIVYSDMPAKITANPVFSGRHVVQGIAVSNRRWPRVLVFRGSESVPSISLKQKTHCGSEHR